jgi:hypothetical protein
MQFDIYIGNICSILLCLQKVFFSPGLKLIPGPFRSRRSPSPSVVALSLGQSSTVTPVAEETVENLSISAMSCSQRDVAVDESVEVTDAVGNIPEPSTVDTSQPAESQPVCDFVS